MKRQSRTNIAKKHLLLSALFLSLFMVGPLYPTPIPDYPLPWPTSKKLPGKPSQPPTKPLSIYTINIE